MRKYEFIDSSGHNTTAVLYEMDHGPYRYDRREYFTGVEYAMAVFLMTDLLTRITLTDNVKAFVWNYYNLIDLAAFIPIGYYFVFMNKWRVCFPCCGIM